MCSFCGYCTLLLSFFKSKNSAYLSDEYTKLKKEVEERYEAMMALHAQKARGFEYANARAAYMAARAKLDDYLASHPDIESD